MDNNFLSKELKNELIKKVQDFFYDEREETIGIIAAEKFVDFMTDVLGIEIYNKGLDDAKNFMMNYFNNLTIDFETLYK